MKGGHQSIFKRHKIVTFILFFMTGIVLILFSLAAANSIRSRIYQARLQPFYNTAGLPLKGKPGEVVRQEPFDISVPNGRGVRVLYRTQRSDGSFTFSSGVVFIPNKPAEGRPMVAWAHGTVGMGDKCAPSRNGQPTSTDPGLADMMQQGWIVTATDYAGFGTPGIQGYLVGGDEGRDVLNSIRAAQNLTGAAGEVAVWGHSQGGSSALFTSNLASVYAPELHIVGTVASAPAAELVPLLNEQYDTLVNWAIGPLIATSWPATNSALNIHDILTPLGLKTYQGIANRCTPGAVLDGLVRTKFGQTLFSQNPLNVPNWKAMAVQQSAPFLAPYQPLLVVESTGDKVVLPNTTALYIKQACISGSDLSTLWLGDVSHQQIAFDSADRVVSWMSDRFAGKPTIPSCGQKLPVAPYAGPAQ